MLKCRAYGAGGMVEQVPLYGGRERSLERARCTGYRREIEAVIARINAVLDG